MAGTKGSRPPSSGRLKRHYREKARREKAMRQRPMGFKEKFVSGCFVTGVVTALVFLSWWTWSCLTAE